jgi:osmoprotectant transport system ATP-binding protein
VIELHDLSKTYDDVKVVDRLDLQIEKGELVVLLGGSGCGKTTTLKMVNRLVEPSSGSVTIDGRPTAELPPHELRRRIGYCFQQVGLFPHMTVGENVAITPRLLGWQGHKIAARVDELLAVMELEPSQFRDRRPSQLSGGQAQRVGLARALAAQAEILLLDEPFGALDPIIRDRLQTFFRDLCRRLGLTVLFVTHDMVEALLLADRIAVMSDGRFLQIGPPAELLSKPAHPIVAELMSTPRRHAGIVDDLLERADG